MSDPKKPPASNGEAGGEAEMVVPEELQVFAMQQMAGSLANLLHELNPALPADRVQAAVAHAIRQQVSGELMRAVEDAKPGSESFNNYPHLRLIITKTITSKNQPRTPLATIEVRKDLTEVAKSPNELMGYLIVMQSLLAPHTRAFLLAHGYDFHVIQVKPKSGILLG